MDFLTQQEVKGIRQDLKNGEVRQDTEKYAYERRLLGDLGKDMMDALEHPERQKESIKFAKKYNKKKKLSTIRENIRKIFGKNTK